MFHGYIPAVVTPFLENNIDLDSFEKYVNWLISSGVNGIAVCGSTGESISLSLKEKESLMRSAVKTSSGKVPVIAGVISAITEDSVEQSLVYEKCGADALLCVCPYYLKPTQDGLFNHFKKIHDSTKLPIILYNNPGRTGVDIKDEAFYKLSLLERVVGIKEAIGDLSRFATYTLNISSKFSLLSANDDTFCGALALGAHGIISVTANVVPALCTDLYAAWKNMDYNKFCFIRDQITNLHKLMFIEPSPGPVKYALSLLRMMGDEVREPLLPISEKSKMEIKLELEKLGII